MSAQEYLAALAAEHQKRVDDYRASQEAKEPQHAQCSARPGKALSVDHQCGKEKI